MNVTIELGNERATINSDLTVQFKRQTNKYHKGMRKCTSPSIKMCEMAIKVANAVKDVILPDNSR